MLLLGSVGLGCGASHAGNTGMGTRRLTDPAQLALEIDRSQAVIDSASRAGASLRRAAGSQQLAFRQLADRRPLRRLTLARLEPGSRTAARAALRAAEALSKIVPAERGFPNWRIVAPPAPNKLLSYFHAAAGIYKIPWQYLAAVELVETRMGRIRGLSPAGARGPMQFMPATWAQYGRGSIADQRDSIMAAARFLKANDGGRDIGRALLHRRTSSPSSHTHRRCAETSTPSTATTTGRSSTEPPRARSSCQSATPASGRSAFPARSPGPPCP